MARWVWSALASSSLVGCSWVFDMERFASPEPIEPLEQTTIIVVVVDGGVDASGERSEPPASDASTDTCPRSTCSGSDVCCANLDGTGSCVESDGKCEASQARLACTGPASCLGFECCIFDFAKKAECMTHCEDIPETHVVCQKDSDCAEGTCKGRRYGLSICVK